MLKGCQREMIMLQTGESRLFESAWFVLRPERKSACEEDMLSEANRIIGVGERRRTRLGRPRRLLYFLWGCTSGLAVAFLLGLFLR